MVRAQAVVLPLLRSALPDAEVVSWFPDTDHRVFPLVWLSRRGGVRHPSRPDLLDSAVFEVTAVSVVGPVEAGELYGDVLEALYGSVRGQIVVPGVGYLHSVEESQGASETVSPFMDSFAVRGSVRVGVRSR